MRRLGIMALVAVATFGGLVGAAMAEKTVLGFDCVVAPGVKLAGPEVDAFCAEAERALGERLVGHAVKRGATRGYGVALDVLAAGDTGMKVRLDWVQGQTRHQGQDMGMAVMDTTMTAQMRARFAQQIMAASDLPFK